MRVRWLSLGLTAGLVAALVHCKDIPADPCESPGTCAALGNVGDASVDASGEVDAAAVPPDCDPNAEANSAAATGCRVDTFALFVDGATGDDANDGSRAKPLKKIATALAKGPSVGKRRVYVCGSDTYAESLKLTTAVHLFGGFACGSWAADAAAKPLVLPGDTSVALTLDGVASEVRFEDVRFEARDAVADGASSVAVFARDSKAKFVRVAIQAGAGKAGAKGANGATGTLTAVTTGLLNLDGNAAQGLAPGSPKECTCSNTASVKSKGGTGGPVEGTGTAGAPNRSAGQGGLGNTACDSGGYGKRGGNALAASPANPLRTLGVLSDDAWTPQAGIDGTSNGEPGQGGGGGGGFNTTNPGGGGACGGCGGTPGKAGQGGGAAVAMIVQRTALTLSASTLSTSAGGTGGSGGKGGDGGTGGGGGIGNCQGGAGGTGGAGSSASGGAGGIAVGILFRGTPPELDPATAGAIQLGRPGAGGAGGKLPPNPNDGPPGIAANTIDADTL